MISMVKISSGEDAWRYFQSTVAADEATEASPSGQASAYYTAEGTPPGRWYGAGIAALGIREGATVTPEQLSHLYGRGAHPVTGAQLAKSFIVPPTLEERVDARVAVLPTSLTEQDRQIALEQIVVEETAHTPKSSVAGFELVFNPPKSVSVWWALADEATKLQIRTAHEEAMRDTIGLLERDALRTRTGVDGVAQAEVAGVVATAFDHWDSRDGDPQLHTHLLVANRVQGLDGKWRTIDSRYGLSPHIVTLSETYTATLMDGLSRRLGVEWVEHEVAKHPEQYQQYLRVQGLTDSQQSRGLFAAESGVPARNQKWEIAGIPLGLLEEFSTRKKAIAIAKDRLVAEYQAKHGKLPDRLTIWRMRQAATRTTRKAKHVHSLQELTTSWLRRAGEVVADPRQLVADVAARGRDRLAAVRHWSVRGEDLVAASIDNLATATLGALSQSRSTWTRQNAGAEIQRLLKPVTFRSIDDRDTAAARVLERVIEQAVRLTPGRILHAPREFTTSDGHSQFAPLSRELFTTAQILEAEQRLVATSTMVTPIAVAGETVEALLATPTEGRHLGDDQARAVERIATSGLALDLLVGPAGAGKTTTLAKLRDVWETQHGAGSVVGLAPSAVAAQVLGDSLGIPTENTAMWLTKATHASDPRFQMRAGQLIIVDEAGMAGTLALDQLRHLAEQAGAKIVLVGDWAQLGAVDAGGAFGLLCAGRGDVAELVDVWRFKTGANPWQADASAVVRVGSAAGLAAYDDAGWIAAGDLSDMMADALHAWQEDVGAGRESLLIAADNSTVATLNEHAQAWLSEAGLLGEASVPISGGHQAHEGDLIVTRDNDRSLRDSHGGWVRNGQEWRVGRVRTTGEAIVVSESGAELVLSPDYLREHVQLGYATTAHRAQGRTVEFTHTLVDETLTREVLYVALTRGSESNRLYVAAGDQSDAEHENTITHGYMDVLEQVLARSGTDTSATATKQHEQERLSNIRQLAAEYETLASTIAHTRYDDILAAALPPGAVDAVRDSAAYHATIALLRRADNHGIDLEATLPGLIASRELSTARDVAAVVHYRLSRALTEQIETAPAAPRQRLIVGLVAAITSPNPDMQRALDEREAALTDRAQTLVARAREYGSAWLAGLGAPTPGTEARWEEAVITIAAYRDRWGVADPEVLGRIDDLNHQRRADHARANTALHRALVCAGLVVDDTADRAERAARLLVDVLPAELADKIISAEAFGALARTIDRASTNPELLTNAIRRVTDGGLGTPRDHAAVLNYRLGQELAATEQPPATGMRPATAGTTRATPPPEPERPIGR